MSNIIALQSWIIRRIHTSMPVFDDIEGNETLCATRLHLPQRHRLAREFKQLEVPLRRGKIRGDG
jgi:hypothetical protein